jgi:capsular exopolysaccharide synthesis family protein
MNRDIALAPERGSWAVEPYESSLQQPSGLAPTLDLPTILRIIRDWRWHILAAVVAGLAIAVIYTMVTTPMYRAWVIMQANPPTVEVLDDQTGGQTDSPQPRDFVATQVGLLSARSLAERVAQDLGLANDAAFVSQDGDAKQRLRAATAKISEGLSVVPPEDGQLISFSFESDSPARAAKIANGIADAFIESKLQRRYESSAYARNFLQRQIAKTRTELEKSERDLVRYAQAEGIINSASGESSNPLGSDANSPQGQSLTQINQALSTATATRVAAEAAYRAALHGGVTTSEASTAQPLRQARAQLQAQYQEKRSIMKADHPEVVSLRKQIEELDRQIARETSSAERARVNELRDAYEAAASAERALQAKVSTLKSQVLDLRGRSIRYAILQRDVDTNRALYDALLQRYKQIGVAGGIGTSPVSIVDHADPPGKPFKPNLLLNVALGLVGGFLFGVLVAIALEYLNDTIKTRQDVRTKLRLPCIGTIPKRLAKSDFVEDLRDPASAVSEAYSTVAASLGFSTESGVPKVLLITSSRPSEGKSSTALALAQNFSRRGRRVLLIDCDTRKPAFIAPSGEGGLTTLLTNGEPIASSISPTHFENLWLLPAGPVPPNPADLLSTTRFRQVIQEASNQFDLVILDAPPVIGLADAPLIASICKDVLFVIESAKTRTTVARECIGKLLAAGAHIIGVTITKSTEERGRHGYGYGYGYGNGYGSGHKYGRIGKNDSQIALIPEQPEADA